MSAGAEIIRLTAMTSFVRLSAMVIASAPRPMSVKANWVLFTYFSQPLPSGT
jgi:hypothetical protein